MGELTAERLAELRNAAEANPHFHWSKPTLVLIEQVERLRAQVERLAGEVETLQEGK